VKRPFGVFVIGVLALVGAAVQILVGLSELGVKGLGFVNKVVAEGTPIGTDTKTLGIVLLVIGGLYLIFAFSFLGLRRWAYTAMFIVQVLAVAAVVYRFVIDGWHWSSLLGAIVPVLIVLYLLMPKVRGAFFSK
jgi:hypothetical protein